MPDHHDENRRTPSKEEILSMTDVGAIDRLVDELTASARKIEVDLQYCTEGSDDWEGRARAALAHHRTALDRLLRHRADLSRSASEAASEARAERLRLKEISAQRQATTEAHAASEKTKRHLLSAIEKASFQAAFIAAAVERFSPDEVDSLYRRATEIQAVRYRAAVGLEQAA